MRKISIVLIGAFLLLGTSFSAAKTLQDDGQNIQVFSMNNADGKITATHVEEAFNASGLLVDVNNNMNSIFEKRYNHVHHKNYNLAIFHSDEMILKLAKKYPSIGLITPLSMSIYSDDAKKSINISTLSLSGMAKVTKIPVNNPDLIAYAKLIDDAVHRALPTGTYAKDIKSSNKLTVTAFTTEFELEDGATYAQAKEEFEEEFEGELGPVGFLIPKSYKLQKALFKGKGLKDYDFFDTYSIIRFNAIYPVSKEHPEAGAYAPFSLLIYKKKGDDTVHIEYPSIDNWIGNLNIVDKETVKAVEKTDALIKSILEELTE